ncbi:ATP-binding protein [Streptomyces lushanensis]|uniref:ATP-binding protein n=1 Tax=Streptomyces lushanensis TaxID=1434255 RepID=UPI00082F91E8|nr:ATP-binding protein [Streptomyces lushanensis]
MAPGNALTPPLIAVCPPGNVVRRYGFQLPAHAESVARARQLTRDRLTRWDMDEETRATAVLVVSELVTNAIVHAAGDRVVCEMREGGGRLRISVEDQGYGPTGPQLHDAAEDETEGEGGRGLFLVDSLCSGWGAHDTSGYGPGRVVWAELPHGELTSGELSHGELPHGTEQPC